MSNINVTPEPPADASGPHAEPDDREEVYFEGSPPIRAIAGAVTLYALVALVLAAVAVLLLAKHIGPWWIKLVLVLIALDLPIIPVLIVKSIRYRITNYRIDCERGLISRTIDTLELWHVEDLHFHQSLADRIFNVGDITIVSHDETMPRLEIRGIPGPLPIYEMLKQRVIAVKRQRGVIKMDPG